MDRAEFWKVIEACPAQAGGDQAAQTASLYDRLGLLSAAEVVSFDAHFRACMRAANRTDLLVAATIIDGFWVSTDDFQDFRSWLVSQGHAVYEAALADPDSLASALEPGDETEFEAFCYIAGRVWEEKAGRNRQEMYGEAGSPSQSSGAEDPKYVNDDEARRQFPRLWAKFHKP